MPSLRRGRPSWDDRQMTEGMLYILLLVLGEIQLRSSRPSHRSHTWWSQFQSDRIRDAGSCPCIPNLKNRRKPSRCHRSYYKLRHCVENSFPTHQTSTPRRHSLRETFPPLPCLRSICRKPRLVEVGNVKTLHRIGIADSISAVL